MPDIRQMSKRLRGFDLDLCGLLVPNVSFENAEEVLYEIGLHDEGTPACGNVGTRGII
jgi:hypothetical protein